MPKAAQTPESRPGAAPGKAAPLDQDALSLADLAKAVLAREIRPRVGSVRRLAQAVLDGAGAGADTKSAADKKKKKSAKPDRKTGGKKRKQAKIPGQKKG